MWNEAIEYAVKIYNVTSCDSFKHDLALKDQLRRSTLSISSSFAEGFERETTKEFIRFLYIAKGSCGESRSQYTSHIKSTSYQVKISMHFIKHLKNYRGKYSH